MLPARLPGSASSGAATVEGSCGRSGVRGRPTPEGSTPTVARIGSRRSITDVRRCAKDTAKPNMATVSASIAEYTHALETWASDWASITVQRRLSSCWNCLGVPWR